MISHSPARSMCAGNVGGSDDKFILVTRFQLISLEWINHKVNGSWLLFSGDVRHVQCCVCHPFQKLDINRHWQLNIMNAPFRHLYNLVHLIVCRSVATLFVLVRYGIWNGFGVVCCCMSTYSLCVCVSVLINSSRNTWMMLQHANVSNKLY